MTAQDHAEAAETMLADAQAILTADKASGHQIARADVLLRLSAGHAAVAQAVAAAGA
ncbi:MULTISPECIES: hypothetical protein [Gordonia]|uniref:hypothetical protein n=1 Tax=Gordonia TaxID=2053 RepID=UPI00257C7B73|nr:MULTISPECIES: hypothetical protein [Gordonia]